MALGPHAGDAAALPLEPTLLAWVERLTGGHVVRARRMDRWRPSYFLDVAGPDGDVALVLKGPRAPRRVEVRSRMLTGYGTRREAAALAALQGSGVAVPKLHGFLPQAGALLIERVPGAGVLQPAAEADRVSLMRQYAGQLATTHQLDAAQLTLPMDFQLPGDPTGPDRPGPLAAVMADYDTLRPKLERPDPLIDLALWWLRRNAPAEGPRCILHGDAGPNQFMFDGSRLTALLDWELSHLGHPMSDLGYARFREALYPSGAFPEFVAEYLATSGRPLDRPAIDYFTVVAGVVMLAGINSDIQRPRMGNPEALQRFWWDALARMAICQVLRESLGQPPLELKPAPQHSGELTTLATLLAARLEADAEHPTSAVPGGSEHTLLLARTILRATQLQPDAGYADDAAALLGTRAADPITQHTAISTLVHEHAADRLDDLVVFFSRQAVRRMDAVALLSATDTWECEAGSPPAADDGWRRDVLLPAFPVSTR